MKQEVFDERVGGVLGYWWFLGFFLLVVVGWVVWCWGVGCCFPWGTPILSPPSPSPSLQLRQEAFLLFCFVPFFSGHAPGAETLESYSIAPTPSFFSQDRV